MRLGISRTSSTLEKLLRNELCPENEPAEENLLLKFKNKLQKKEKKEGDDK